MGADVLTEHMTAALYVAGGAAVDVLRIEKVAIPEPGNGEVRIRLAASGVNPRDVRLRANTRPLKAPVIPHSDGAGTIDRVGPGGDPKELGKRVWIFNAQWERYNGTAAEYVVLPRALVVELPESVSFQEGACLGTPALTAAIAMNRLGATEDKTVLITGGGSSVGFLAIQIARACGTRIIATTSRRRQALAERAGATIVLDRESEDLGGEIRRASHGKGVDCVIDLDLSSLAPLLPQGVVAHGGIIVSYGSHNHGPIDISFDTMLARGLSLQVFGVHAVRLAERAAALKVISSMLADGTLSASIGASFALADIAAAHEAVETGLTLGKVVLTI